MKRIVFRLLSLATLLVLILPAGGLAADRASALRAPVAAENGVSAGLFINEVMFAPTSGGYEWVELKNGATMPVRPLGYRITDEDGNDYRLPTTLPAVPPGAFVVVLFDGQGEAGNDLDFADNVATLHTAPGVVDVFEDSTDQVALYNTARSVYLPLLLSGSTGLAQGGAWDTAASAPAADVVMASGIVAFVAWGAEPGQEATAAEAAGIWREDWYVGLSRGLGVRDDVFAAGQSIGLLPDQAITYPGPWEIFQGTEVTRGT